MGYMRHNAIVVTSWSEVSIVAAAQKANELGLQVLGPSDSVINGYCSLLICPDGSKESWLDSNVGEDRREAFRAWLDGQKYDDGSTNLEWVEIAYGDDDRSANVVHTAWESPKIKAGEL